MLLVFGVCSCSVLPNIIAQEMSNVSYPSPLRQILAGIDSSKVSCNEGLELILKKSTGTPACVKAKSVSLLIERGWAIHILPDYSDNKKNSDLMESGNLEITTTNVNYFNDFNGFLAQPKTDGTYPGIVMIHEWWGLNENIEQMAEDLASEGYIVLAVDLYGKSPATTTNEARQLVSNFNLDEGLSNMNAAVSFIEQNYEVETFGSIGWCFGGGQSLNLAIDNDKMDATVIYYGQLTTDQSKLSTIDWPILGIFAELDSGIPPTTVNEFENSLNELEIQNEVYIYPEVDHAFANPSGDRYAPEETKDAWKRTLTFFDKHLK